MLGHQLQPFGVFSTGMSEVQRPHFLVNLYFRCSGDRAAPEPAAEYFAPQADDRMWSPINRLLGRHYEWVSRLL